jgi:double-strand break repair protein MRE11
MFFIEWFLTVVSLNVFFPDEVCVNYEDPNLNISLPVFIIHGNHDDPSGEGQYSALDLLSTCGLLNYFGKQDRIDDIIVKPLLLTKGASRIAIFGLGNIRDERLQKTFESKKVRWLRPPDDGGPSWFNILVIHQNKVEHNPKNTISFESHIPDWIDFVLWGHEHECLIEPVKRGDKVHYLIKSPMSSACVLRCGPRLTSPQRRTETATPGSRSPAPPSPPPSSPANPSASTPAG